MGIKHSEQPTMSRFRLPFEATIAVVLDGLGLRWNYLLKSDSEWDSKAIGNQSCFQLEDNRVRIFAEPIYLLEGARRIDFRKFWKNIILFEDGLMLNFITGEADVLLRWCKVCYRVFFDWVNNNSCPYCSTTDIQYVAYNHIPYFKKLANPKFRSQFRKPGYLKKLFGLEESVRGQLIKEDSLPDLSEDILEPSREKLVENLRGEVYHNLWPSSDKLQQLDNRHPNKSQVMDLIFDHFRFSSLRKSPGISLPNLLLVGEPACGKTVFSKELANLLSPDRWAYYDLGQGTPFFSLVGSDSSIKRSKPGLIYSLFAGTNTCRPCKNPIIIFDEIDKLKKLENSWDPLPALHNICDKKSAERFRDEYLNIHFDASGMTVIALANRLDGIPHSLVSRFQVFEIPSYSQEDFESTVIPNIYKEWLETVIPGVFPPVLSQESIRAVAVESNYMARKVFNVLSQRAASGDLEHVTSSLDEKHYRKSRAKIVTEPKRPPKETNNISFSVNLSPSMQSTLHTRSIHYQKENNLI